MYLCISLHLLIWSIFSPFLLHFTGWPYTLQGFEVDTLTDELLGWELQDTYVRQSFAKGRQFQRNLKFFAVRQTRQQLPNWNGHQKSEYCIDKGSFFT